jgi:hypothetical protein
MSTMVAAVTGRTRDQKDKRSCDHERHRDTDDHEQLKCSHVRNRSNVFLAMKCSPMLPARQAMAINPAAGAANMEFAFVA